jgi:biofilm PGA synthesis lipoprotein PgaB
VRQQVTDIYEDLARYASFNGILFHDDAVLTDVDDAGQDAAQDTTRQKSRLLMGFTHALSQAVKHIRGPQIKTAQYVRLTHSAARKRSVVCTES